MQCCMEATDPAGTAPGSLFEENTKRFKYYNNSNKKTSHSSERKQHLPHLSRWTCHMSHFTSVSPLTSRPLTTHHAPHTTHHQLLLAALLYTMLKYRHFITTITRHDVSSATYSSSSRSSRHFCSEWRNNIISFRTTSTSSVDRGLLKNAYPWRFLYCVNDYAPLISRRYFHITSYTLLDPRFTRKDSNKDDTFVAQVAKSGEKKLIDKNTRTTTTAALNQRAAGAILTQLSSIPNILTLSRIMVTPYLSYLLITHYHTKQTPLDAVISAGVDAPSAIVTHLDPASTPMYALSLFLLMGFTDFLDGFIARKYPSQSTVLGTYLDPIADKVFISTMSLTLWYTETLPGMVVLLWIARDIGIVAGVYYTVKQETLKRMSTGGNANNNVAVMDPQNTPLKVQASLISKLNTTLQIGLIALGIAGEVPAVGELPGYADLMTALCWITVGTTITSTVGYLTPAGSAFRKSGNNK